MSRVHLGVSPNAEIPLHTYRTRQHTPPPRPTHNTQHTRKHNDGIDSKHKNTSAKSLEKYHLPTAYVSNHMHTHPERKRETHTHTEREREHEQKHQSSQAGIEKNIDKTTHTELHT